MSPRDTNALARQEILNVSIVTHDDQNVAARCGTPEQHLSAMAIVESQRDGITASSESEQHDLPAQINRLPEEILGVIFHLAHVSEWITHTALKMGSVCRRWREIVTGMGVFWTDVRVGRVDLARLSVERSQEAPLEFSLAEILAPGHFRYPIHAYAPEIFPETAVKLLIASIGRVHKLLLTLHIDTYLTLLPRLASFTAPFLQTLHLDISEEEFIDYYSSQAALHDTENLTSRCLVDAPSLTHLSIETHRLPGKLTIYPNINFLSLRLIARDLLVHDSSFILGTMGVHEQLTELHLALHSRLLARKDDTVHLLHLSSLSLTVTEIADARYLLSRMKIPEIERVTLYLGTRFQASPLKIGSCLKKVLSRLPPTFRQTPTNIVFEKAEFTVIMSMKGHPSSSRTLTIRLHWRGVIDMPFLRNIANNLSTKFPCLSVASYDQTRWVLGEQNVEELSVDHGTS